MVEESVEPIQAKQVTWYGPYPCSVCGFVIVKAAREDGGQELEPPERLMQVFRRGSESSDPDLVYPMVWTLHVHRNQPLGPREPVMAPTAKTRSDGA